MYGGGGGKRVPGVWRRGPPVRQQQHGGEPHVLAKDLGDGAQHVEVGQVAAPRIQAVEVQHRLRLVAVEGALGGVQAAQVAADGACAGAGEVGGSRGRGSEAAREAGRLDQPSKDFQMMPQVCRRCSPASWLAPHL